MIKLDESYEQKGSDILDDHSGTLSYNAKIGKKGEEGRERKRESG